MRAAALPWELGRGRHTVYPGQPSASALPSALIKRSGAAVGERKQRAVVGPSCPVDGVVTVSEIGRWNGDGWWPSLYATTHFVWRCAVQVVHFFSPGLRRREKVGYVFEFQIVKWWRKMCGNVLLFFVCFATESAIIYGNIFSFRSVHIFLLSITL